MTRTQKIAASGTLAVLLSAGAQAFPPRMRSERGIVTEINSAAQTISLRVCCEREQFVWRDWTRIRINGRKVKPEEIPVGTTVRVSYRHELGEQSLYEVRSTREGDRCSEAADCAQ